MASPYYYQAPYNPYQQMYQPQPIQNMQNYQSPPQNMQNFQSPQQTQQPVVSQQIQLSGIVSVPSEKDVDEYPVAPGNCVTFRLENAPYLITKTKTFSPLEQAQKKYYKLIEEEPVKGGENARENTASVEQSNITLYATKAEIEPIFARLEALEADRNAKKTKKKEGNDDE